jgi:hypothetical protein
VNRRRIRLAATTTVVAALGLAACGGPRSSGGGTDPPSSQSGTPAATNVNAARPNAPAGTGPSSGAALAVITGDRNSPLAVLTPTLSTLMQRAVRRDAGFAIVDAGGRPRLFSVGLGAHLGNSDAENAVEQQQLSEAGQAIDRVTPTTAESDPWTAFDQAVGWLQGQGGGTVVVANSGLGTTGFLDYRQPGFLAAEPADLVAFARHAHELPDATGIDVVLLGIGWTTSPQPSLTGPERSNLVAQ